MPLVEYDSSEDESNSENETTNKDQVETVQKSEPPKKNSNDLAGETKVKSINDLPIPVNQVQKSEEPEKNSNDLTEEMKFNSIDDLPVPVLQNQDVSWDLLTSKPTRQHKVKILLPKIPEIDPADRVKRSFKTTMKGSSLISLLPTPKKDTALFPNQVFNALKGSNRGPKLSQCIPLSSKASKSSPKPSSKSKKGVPKTEQTSLSTEHSDSDDDLETNSLDFLGLSRKNVLEDSEIQLGKPMEQELVAHDSKLLTFPFPPPKVPVSNYLESRCYQSMELPTPAVENQIVELDDDALTQLCGSKGKRKRGEANIELIDIDGSSLVSDSMDWHTKELTVERKVSSRKKNGPTSQQRRKHQITYLAFQAKEQELELTNQWANNRMTRKQTQARYGF